MLDIDCVVHILSQLSFRDRRQCRQVCQQWKTVSDHLSFREKELKIVSYYYKRRYKESSNTIIWPKSYIQYSSFCNLLQQFPNLKSLSFVGLDHWCDPMIHEMSASCPSLNCIEFVSCAGLGINRWDDYFYNNVTEHGWQELIATYSGQVTKLVLKNCSLDDKQLCVIIENFDQLTYLDITENNIINGESLANLGDKIEVLKVGPTMTSDNSFIELPVKAIVSGNGRNLKELHLQGFLSPQINFLSMMKQLDCLVIQFIKPLFENDSIDYFSVIATAYKLRRLEIYQYNSHDGVMLLTSNQLSVIVNGCRSLQKLIVNCDPWCDSNINDTVITQLSHYCPELYHLSICPGSFLVTDKSLNALSKLPLKVLSLSSFPALTDCGIFNLITRCNSMDYLYLEDCNEITQKFMTSLSYYFKENPSRKFSLELCNSKITADCQPSSFPSNLKIITNEKLPIKTSINMSTIISSIFHAILSFITIISTFFSLSLTLIVFFIKQCYFINFSFTFSEMQALIVTNVLSNIYLTNLFIYLFILIAIIFLFCTSAKLCVYINNFFTFILFGNLQLIF